MTMTLEQVRDKLRSYAKDADTYASKTGQTLELTTADKMADAIDAHIAGMGEPVAHFIETSQGNWEQAADMFRGQPGVRPLYTAPPIDIAAVREVIVELRYDNWGCPISLVGSQKLHALADKLEAAMPKESK